MNIQKTVLILLQFFLVVAGLITSHIVVTSMQERTFIADRSMSGDVFWKEHTSVKVSDGKSVPSQLPGPLDSWAGGNSKEIQLSVSDPPAGDRLFLRMYFADSHEAAPPLLQVALNGKTVGHAQVAPGAGLQPGLWAGKGKSSKVTLELPNPSGKVEPIVITIKSVEGSWVGFEKATLFSKVSKTETRVAKGLWAFLVVLYIYYLTFAGNFERHKTKALSFTGSTGKSVAKICNNQIAMAFMTFCIIMAVTGVIREDLIPFNASEVERLYLIIGDEPEYFLAAYSLAHDFDMDVSNNARNKDWKLFFSRDAWEAHHGSLNYFKRFAPKMKDITSEEWGGMQLLVHRPGLSALIAPATYSDTRLRWWSYFSISIFGAVIISLIVLTVSSAGAHPFFVAVTATCIAITPPSLFYFNQVLPEIPMSVILSFIAALMIKPSPSRLYLAAVLVNVAPWFSDRALLAAFILGIGCIVIAKNKRERAILVAIFAVGSLFLAHYYQFRFGVPWPLDHHPYVHASISEIPYGLPRHFLDAGKGIIWLSPILILAPSAFYEWWKSGENRVLFWFLSASVIVTAMLISAHPDWTGGGGPAGRYAMVLVWLSLPAFFIWIKTGMTPIGKALFFFLLFFGVFEAYMVSIPAGWMYSKFHPLFQYGAIAGWYTILPNLVEYTSDSILRAVVWFSIFVMVAISAVFPFRWMGDQSTK